MQVLEAVWWSVAVAEGVEGPAQESVAVGEGVEGLAQESVVVVRRGEVQLPSEAGFGWEGEMFVMIQGEAEPSNLESDTRYVAVDISAFALDMEDALDHTTAGSAGYVAAEDIDKCPEGLIEGGLVVSCGCFVVEP